MKRVLIVDDEHTTRELLAAMLRIANYEVIGMAADADTALAACRELRPDLVLLDIELRQGNGLEVLESLRAEQSAIAVIMVSGETQVERVKQARQLGADSFVAKPFNIARLVRALNHVSTSRGSGLHQNP